MNIFSAAASVGTRVREQVEQALSSGVQHVQDDAVNDLTAAGVRVVQRVADSPDAQVAISKLGKLAAAPTKRQLQPTILLAAVGLAIAIGIIVHSARSARPVI